MGWRAASGDWRPGRQRYAGKIRTFPRSQRNWRSRAVESPHHQEAGRSESRGGRWYSSSNSALRAVEHPPCVLRSSRIKPNSHHCGWRGAVEIQHGTTRARGRGHSVQAGGSFICRRAFASHRLLASNRARRCYTARTFRVATKAPTLRREPVAKSSRTPVRSGLRSFLPPGHRTQRAPTVRCLCAAVHGIGRSACRVG